MLHSELLFQTPYWFLIFCILLGVIYAFFLYQNVGVWGKKLNYILAAVRGITVAIIVFLLLNPLVKQTTTIVEKAKVVFAIDNSESVKMDGTAALNLLKKAKEELVKDGFQVEIQNLNETVAEIDSIQFDLKKTDLSQMLRAIQSNNQGQNLTNVLLLSDGIFNQGISPIFENYPFKINTIGVGDTIPVTDIRIADVVMNKVAFLGNDFPIEVNIAANGLAGKSASLVLKQDGKVISSKTIQISNSNFVNSYSFTGNSKIKGIQHYNLELSTVSSEQNVRNNRKDVYIDIIDGRQKILLLAAVPHPDLKAIRAIIETNDNYEVDVKIIAVSIDQELNSKPYDLVILHQIPNKLNLGNEFLNKLVSLKTPLFFVLGNQSNFAAFNNINKALLVKQAGSQMDKVFGFYNTDFQQINLDQASLALLEKLPPISVPFGDYQLAAGSEVILNQKVGNMRTLKPMLLINSALETKVGIFLGEGLWQWRMEEYALTGKHEIVDNLFQKLFQLTSIREDKRKFRAYTSNKEYNQGETVIFRTEIYNELYERVYGPKVNLILTDEKANKQQFSFNSVEDTEDYKISGLKSGVYKFEANSTLSNKVETVLGQFIIVENDIELANTTANFTLLRELANKSGGSFYENKDIDSFVNNLKQNRPPDKLESSDSLMDIIHLKWLFFLLLFLLAIEWGTRKYSGEY